MQFAKRTEALEVPPFLQDGAENGARLRAMDWRKHPLGPPDGWHPALKTVVGIVLGSQQPMAVCWGPQLHAIYNDSFAAMCGDHHPVALAAPFSNVGREIWHVVSPMMPRIFLGEAIQMDNVALARHRKGDTNEAQFSFSFTPVRSDSGEVLGMFCACCETSDQMPRGPDLPDKDRVLDALFGYAPSFMVKLEGPNHLVRFANQAAMHLIGARDILGKSIATALPELVDQGYIGLLDKVLSTAKTIRIEGERVNVQRAADGGVEELFVDYVFQPIVDAAGRATGILINGVDVTARERATSALRDSEEFLRSVLLASPDCIKVLNLNGEIIYINDGARQVLEVPLGTELIGCNWPDFWNDPGKSDALRCIAQAKLGHSTSFQGFTATFAGNVRFWDVRVTPMLDHEGRPERILAVSRDHTYLKQLEQERDYLTQELAHRLKNAFAMVQSVMSQTLRQTKSLTEGREVLSGRIQALAAAQNILTDQSSSDMKLTEVVNAALLPHRTGECRFDISGGDARISGQQGLGLSLALHELATNARKYGALSNNVGKVLIRWQIAPDGGFEFIWTETGGPPVAPPVQTGFGSMLIEKIVATYFEGSAQLSYPVEGVQFNLSGMIQPNYRSLQE